MLRYNHHVMYSHTETSHTHHLPQAVTPFVGREQELADIDRRLADPACCLLTLVGPGGIGKTRLAIQVTAASAPHFSDGAYFVNLQPVETEELLLTAVADALDIPLSSQETALATIQSFLADRQLLLTLDNFEQLLDASPLLSELLSGTRVTILTTSRETLNLQEEWLYPVGGMSFPTQTPPPHELADYNAIQLFAERARRVRPDFALEAETESVAKICRMVEGMPLALELAAPWLKFMDCAEIVVEIERNCDFLAARLRNVSERHRSIQAVFAQTWQGLNEQEQAVFQRLTIFRGGFLRDSAVNVAGASLSLLSSLLDKSLLRWEADEKVGNRYQIHELLRQFAAEKLAAQPETAVSVQAQHARYYLAFLAQRLPDLLGGRQMTALLEITAERNNIHTAWQWAVEKQEWSAINDTLEALHQFCVMQGRHAEGIALFQQAYAPLFATVNKSTHPFLGRLLSRLRFMQLYTAAPPAAIEADLHTSLDIAQAENDPLETAFSLLALGGFTFYLKNDPAAAMTLFEQSLSLFRAQNHGLYESRVLGWMGVAHPDLAGLERYTRQSLAVARACGSKMDMLNSLSNLAEVALIAGDTAAAEAYCEEAIATADEMQSHIVSTHTKTLLSLVYFLRGDWETAMDLAQAGLAGSRKLKFEMAIGYAEAFVGLYASMAGDYALGRRLGESSKTNPVNERLGLMAAHWALATACCGLELDTAAWEATQAGIQLAQTACPREDVGANSPTMTNWLLPVTAVLLHRQGKSAEAAARLAEAAVLPPDQMGWMAKWAALDELKGEMDTAVLSGEETAVFANQALIDPLTNRELEVLHLIAGGLTNRQIAEQLIISKGTVKYYTSVIYSKLQVSNRTQAVAHARELGMLP
ncbi:MAG: hypothetical protein GY796_23115 [Chloroflexi bacterium]|nr:hypothetical protein [Chloroflexota bacterium]